MIPLTILTGFLGAGKTTALNRTLGASHRRRLAVIVNELGRIDVDGKLLRSRSGDIVELTGGCVCHEARTQDELWSAIDEIAARSNVDRVVLETTGIAEPQSIIEGLAALPDEKRRVYDAGVVTVVDAEAGLGHIEFYSEARAQIAGADRILLAKMDLARATTLPYLHEALSGLNPRAEKAAFPDPGSDESLAAWILDRPSGRVPSFTTGHRPHAHSQITSLSFSSNRPLLADRLLTICQDLGPRLVRAKGFVNAAGDERRGFLELAGDRLGLKFEGPWPPGPRRSDLVFIGDRLDPGVLERQLWAIQVVA